MVRSPCSSDDGLKKGPWSPEEDQILIDYVNKHGYGSWQALAKRAGLNRCGKSCRLRWTNYLRPDIKRGGFSDEEEKAIISLHSVLGNKWSRIASHLPGRTDNEIKNYWNTHLRKKLIKSGIDPQTHKKIHDFDLLSNNLSQFHFISNMLNLFNPLEIALAAQIFAKNQLIQNILQATNTNPFPNFQETSMILPGSENLVVLDGLINGEISNNPINYNDSARSGLEIDHRNSQHTNSSWNIVEGDFNPDENILPPVVTSTSATPGSPNLNIMDDIDDMYIFDDLEKIVDSDANSFFILDRYN